MSPDKAKDMMAALEVVKEELEDRCDTVDGDNGEPYPNWAMRLLDAIEKVLVDLEKEAQ